MGTVYGQGNLFVRVDFDVLAEASVLAVLSSLEASSGGAGDFEGAASRQPALFMLSSHVDRARPHEPGASTVAALPDGAGAAEASDRGFPLPLQD